MGSPQSRLAWPLIIENEVNFQFLKNYVQSFLKNN